MTSFALFPHLKLFTRFVKTAKESPPSQNRTRSCLVLRLNDLTKTGFIIITWKQCNSFLGLFGMVRIPVMTCRHNSPLQSCLVLLYSMQENAPSIHLKSLLLGASIPSHGSPLFSIEFATYVFFFWFEKGQVGTCILLGPSFLSGGLLLLSHSNRRLLVQSSPVHKLHEKTILKRG